MVIYTAYMATTSSNDLVVSTILSNDEDTTTALMSESGPPEPYLMVYWLLSELVLILVTCFTIYLLVCLARYALVSRCKPGRELNHKKGKALYRLCFVSVAMALGRFAADQAVAVVGWRSDDKCYTSVATSTVFYTLSLYPVYIFLWMRQSIFYANPVLSHILNPVVTFISYATLVVMLIGGGTLGVLYILPNVTGWEHVATDHGCRDVNNSTVVFDLVPMLVVCFVVSFQISLLALFLYPLLTKKMRKYQTADSTSSRHGSAKVPGGGGVPSASALSRDMSTSNNSLAKKQPLPVNSSRPPSVAIDVEPGAGDSATLKATTDSASRPPRAGRAAANHRVLCRDGNKTSTNGGGGADKSKMARLAVNNAASEAAAKQRNHNDATNNFSDNERKRSKR